MTLATVHQLPVTPKRRQVNVNSWRWNEIEEDAIADLPHEAQILYLRVIRKHMDYSTGITGEKRRISYTQMQETLAYKPPRHSKEKPVEYSRDQIKRLVQKLVDAGLIERMHTTEKGVAPMVFSLPLASSDVNEQRHESATATPPHQNPHGCGPNGGDSATRPPHENDEQRHPSGSGSPNTSSYEEEFTADADSPADGSKSSKAKDALPNCPHADMLDLWAEIMPDRRQPIRSMWTKGARAKNLAARWKQGFSITNEQTGNPLYTDTASGLEWWGRFFRFLRKSEFLMRDDSRFFGLDWIAKSENFEKIMELKYHGGES